MEIIPATDLHRQVCSPLRGERTRETIYSDNPAEIARNGILGAGRSIWLIGRCWRGNVLTPRR